MEFGKHIRVIAGMAIGLALTSGLAEVCMAKQKVILLEVWPTYRSGAKAIWERCAKDLNIDIEVWVTDAAINDKFLAMTMAGKPPDLVLYVQAPWARAGMMEPLDSYLKTSKVVDKDIFEPRCLSAWKYQGRQLALPTSRNHYIMEYNLDLFDKAGVASPPVKWDTPDWTWEYVRNISPKFTLDKNGDGKTDQWGIDSLKTPFTWPWYWGGEMVSQNMEVTIDTPLNRKSFEYMVDMSRNLLGGSFYSGTAAMGMQGSWNLGGQFKPLKFRANVAPAPKGTHAATVQYVDGMGIHKAAKNKKGAWQVIEWLLKGNHQNELELILDVYGWTPAIASSRSEWEARQKRVLGSKAKDVTLESLWDGRSYGIYPWQLWHPTQPDYERVVWGDSWNRVLRGRSSVEQWLKESQRAIDALTKNRKK